MRRIPQHECKKSALLASDEIVTLGACDTRLGEAEDGEYAIGPDLAEKQYGQALELLALDPDPVFESATSAPYYWAGFVLQGEWQ